ncbi:MarR family winged helix-turn-helix transcriptional regulator [Arthrobacter sp. Soil763]|uniref:MarR family winged helix-turn-helix transcriptional regulator n=1 Tax=Arthrobacter sp. Soil763 TaxID=1736402 RepID=UPI000A6A60B0|nr:MarR family transcriptional regulator [Arthrobacter sp. Soil763]
MTQRPESQKSADTRKWRTDQLLSMAARVVERRKDQALAALGLTHAAVIALRGLADGAMNQEQLARRIGVQSQSLGKVLGRLEESGLVTRTKDVNDRRQFSVSLTPAGSAALATAYEIERDALPEDLEGWSSLHNDLTRILAAFEVPGRS